MRGRSRAEPRHVVERSSGRNVATTGRDASAEVVAAAAAAAAAAAGGGRREGDGEGCEGGDDAGAAAGGSRIAGAGAAAGDRRRVHHHGRWCVDANPESAAEVADAATAASDCPACAGRHRPHTCDRRKGRKERKRDALSPVRPERCAPASMP